jgi:hypothetical protein
MKDITVGCVGVIAMNIVIVLGVLLLGAIWSIVTGSYDWTAERDVQSLVVFGLLFFGSIAVVYAIGKESSAVTFDNRYQLSATYPPNWNEIRQEVLARDGYRCGNCGSTSKLHVHHIVPLSLGGSNELGNLRTLCKICHVKLHPHMRG